MTLRIMNLDVKFKCASAGAIHDITSCRILIQIQSNGKRPQLVKARSLLCYWAVKELEMNGTEIAKKLNVSNSAVSRSVARGERLAAEMKLKLIEY